MNGRDIFKIWAPTGAKWVDWVRPVPFISINEELKIQEFCNFSIPNIIYSIKNNDTAIIVDLPDYESIKEGIALAIKGFRPIPVYNGTDEQEGASATVNNHIIEVGLIWGASKLQKIQLENNARPAFLVNTNRMNRVKMNETVFDNSWDIYNQDLPTAEYFLKEGINKILIISQSIQKDLNKILYDFQKKGIQILLSNRYEEPKIVKIKKTFYKN